MPVGVVCVGGVWVCVCVCVCGYGCVGGVWVCVCVGVCVTRILAVYNSTMWV